MSERGGGVNNGTTVVEI